MKKLERPSVIIEGPAGMRVGKLKNLIRWCLEDYASPQIRKCFRIKSFKHTVAREAIFGKTERKRLDGRRGRK